MKNTFVAAIAAFFMTGAVSAAEITGEVAVEVVVDGDVVTTTEELTFGFTAGDGIATGSVTLDEDGIAEYSIGTMVGNVSLSYGDQSDIMIEGGLNALGGTTLADPVSGDTSLIAGYGTGQVLVGFNSALDDVDNVQFAYSMDMLAVSVDYNFNSDDLTVIGAGTYTFSEVDTQLIVSYNDMFAYELSASYNGFTAYLDGDEDDATQNLGLGYESTHNGLTYFVEAEYNFDDKDLVPAFGLSLSF